MDADDEVFVDPVKELAEALGMKPGDVIKLRKAVYGLTTAPRKWWLRICFPSCGYEAGQALAASPPQAHALSCQVSP